MVMTRKKKRKSATPGTTYDSDDERAYSKEKVPDPRDDDFYQDDVDEFHAQKEKVLLEKGVRPLEPAGFSSDEKEEVLGLGGDDSSDDEEVEEYRQRLKQLRRHGVKEGFQSDSDSEDEGAKKNDGLPDEKAWGKKRKGYYWADEVSDDDYEGSGDEPAGAELEEREALNLQRKMAEQLDDSDFGLGLFKPVAKPEKKEQEKITTDVSRLSHRAKLELLQKESPELLDLIDDYKTKMTELTTRWMPLMELVKSGALPPSQGTKYIRTKTQVGLNYCVNVSFYLMLKAKHTPQLYSHPIVNRLVQYRKIMKQLEGADQQMETEVNDLLTRVKAGEDIKLVTSRTASSATSASSVTSRLLHKAKRKEMRLQKAAAQGQEEESDADDQVESTAEQGGRTWGRKRKVDDGLTAAEREAMAFYDATKKKRRPGEDEGDDQDRGEDQEEGVGEANPGGAQRLEEEELDGKRGVTYQILKNKGLQAPKKKEHRNPRVKNRMKARRQKIRRKGQVREVRTEMSRYGGEISGIRAGIKRGVKFR